MLTDLNKGISEISYNSLNLPSKLVISNSAGSATNTYLYDSDGRKLCVTMQGGGSNSKKTDYVGNLIYENGSLKRILVDGGYIENGVYHYYLQDHLGNNRVVAKADGTVVQTTHYYPYGMSFAEGIQTSNQPYKYNSKELDSERGLNLYDYVARGMDPALGRFTTIDPMAEKYYSISPYAYCIGNPVNTIDSNGKLVIFINGMHFGDGGQNDYWDKNGGGFATAVMNYLNDHNDIYKDGSIGGVWQLPYNLDPQIRHRYGLLQGEMDAPDILRKITDSNGKLTETIKVITHSMGSAYAKGYVEALKQLLKENEIPFAAIEFEADFAPFQPRGQKAVKDIKTIQFTNMNDKIANNESLNSPFGIIQGVENAIIGIDEGGHSIVDFFYEINKLPAGNYRIENGVIIPQN